MVLLTVIYENDWIFVAIELSSDAGESEIKISSIYSRPVVFDATASPIKPCVAKSTGEATRPPTRPRSCSTPALEADTGPSRERASAASA